MKTLYEKALELMGDEEISTHESDLYLKKNEVSDKLIKKYEFRWSAIIFINQIDGTPWYDVPFAYDPFWIKGKVTMIMDGIPQDINIHELLKLKPNVILARSNGYSHDWDESVPFELSHLKYHDREYTIQCTSKPLGRIPGSSIVSFS